MSALSRHSMVILSLAALGVVALILATEGSRAKAGESEARMTSYRTPTGREMSATAAADSAVTRFAREDAGVLGPVEVTTAHTDFAKAQAVVEGQPLSAAEYDGPADIAEWRASPVYLVVMKAAPGAVFAPNVSTPRGKPAPTGNVMSVILDAHTGFKEGLSLETTMPAGMSELGPLTRSEAPAVTAAQAAALPSGNVGSLVGKVNAGGRAEPGWRVLVGKGAFVRNPIARHLSGPHGVFSFRLAPGEYRIGAWNPHGGLCGAHDHVRVRRHHMTKINLDC